MFGRDKLIKELELQKAMIAEFEFQVTQQNEMYQALYSFLSSGVSLSKDSKMKDYVREGYEGNPDLFSIISKLAGMFAGVPLQPMILKGDKYEEVENEEVNRFFERTNYYQTWNEFKKHWVISAYVTGNMIVYAPKFPAGVNKGKITLDGLIVMPSQNVNIEASGWRKPIGHYTLDIDQSYKIEPEDVWHERFAPTLSFETGKNFMGQSPLKVAREIINSQNAGYAVTAAMYKHGHPPGILYKEAVEGDTGGTTESQESKFRERYQAKYQGTKDVRNLTIPIFTVGKTGFTKIGYDNLQELQVINMSEHGRRVFCNILQVPAQLFNDTEASTYNNMREAQKAIYTNRIIPDLNTFCEGFNGILKPYGDIILRPNFSDIECLQQEKKEKVEWVSRMFNDAIITGDQYLEMLGEEPTNLPEMQVRYIAANKIPLNFSEGEDIERSNRFYLDYNITDAAKRQVDVVDWRRIYEEGGAHWTEDLQPTLFAQEFAQKLVKEGKKSILEIGCGNGRDSILFAVAGLDVIGIDLVPEAVRIARENAERVGVEVNFQEGNAESLAFPDFNFDAVYTLSVLHSTDMGKSLPEIARVLKQKGLAFIYIYSGVQKIDGTVTEYISVNEFIKLLTANKFIITNIYTEQDEEYDEVGEKHSIIITEVKKK